MNAIQLPLFVGQQDANSAQITLERKSYIQPFECVLAYAELNALLGQPKDDLFSEMAPQYASIPGDVDVTMLKRRLAYWQSLTAGDTQVTDQVLYELSDKSSPTVAELLARSVQADQLPTCRRLRYGPHDLHEYRGKFFPQLVRSLINAAGLDRGSVVIDPMCGSGTTNCESRSIGMKAIGMDLNPLSVLVSRTKSRILDLTPELLSHQARELAATISKSDPHLEVDLTERWDGDDLDYLRRWFAQPALAEVARVLQILETCEHPVVLSFLQVCLSNTLRQVSWQKDTDLRVRKEVIDYTPGTAFSLFAREVSRQVKKLVRYLALLNDARPFPESEIYEGDARGIDQRLSQWKGRCDLLITSPPYATALPYIDTDRLSLIVLGLLPRSEHRPREYRMIGNREVLQSQRQDLWNTYQRRRHELPDEVCELIDRIAQVYHSDEVGFRRRNKPALLARYYLDMVDAMRSSLRMMRPGSLAFYVVGNNFTRMNGERVDIPTNRFLWKIGSEVGWHQEAVIDMEMLPSRDIFSKNTGSSESILVFRSPFRRAIYGQLSVVRDQVTDDGWDFQDADTQQHLHSIHPYPARFIPQIPRKAIAEYSETGDRILDPFCGCGTALLESILMGRPAIGVDNNAVACLVSRAKTASYAEDHLEQLQEFLHQAILSHFTQPHPVWIPEYRNRDYWFDQAALQDLGRLRYAINQLSQPVHDFALAVFSSIIVRASFQDSDTRYTKVDRAYEPGSALKWYQEKLTAAIDALQQVIDKPKAEACVHLADGRQLSFVEDNSIQLIVTSPPYLNAYDYHKYHRHRLHWIGGSVQLARDQEIGKHDVFTRPNADPQLYFDNMHRCFREWARVLRPGGYVLIIIGDAIVGGEPVPTADRFVDILTDLHLNLQHRWLRNLETSKKSFNQRSRIRQEHLLLFRSL